MAFWTYVSRKVKVNLWKPDIPEFWKHFWWFGNIRSMQNRSSTLLKHVGSSMRLFKLYDAQTCSKNELKMHKIIPKMSKKSLCSNHQEQCNYHVSVSCKPSAIEFVFGLYENDRSHFLDFKLNSMKTFSIGFSGVYLFKILHGIEKIVTGIQFDHK